VAPHSVARFERGGAVKAGTLEAIQRTLEKAGVIFVDASEGGPVRGCARGGPNR
jgi:hypothetical protein